MRILSGVIAKKPMSPQTSKFLIEEYKALRKEIELYIRETRNSERYLIIATGAVWGWLSAHGIKEGIAWSIPIFLAFGVGLRSLVILAHFMQMGSHIRKIEDSFGVEGWEHKTRFGLTSISSTLLWLVLLILSFMAYNNREKLTLSLDSEKTKQTSSAPQH